MRCCSWDPRMGHSSPSLQTGGTGRGGWGGCGGHDQHHRDRHAQFSPVKQLNGGRHAGFTINHHPHSCKDSAPPLACQTMDGRCRTVPCGCLR